ncbi:FHA domain-containing protein [Nocardia sp. NBC_00881]|uniref:FHA domain-containing protein n=1 Tax=Nocardia sp. NBC_00881 TaxID=2975995 RepID=UPI003864A737|nr:FHA domain-containing protein [Nocardia sp. NBC_00881]
MDASGLLAEVPSAVRDLVIGHWPEMSVDGMRRRGDAYIKASEVLNDSADQYEAEASRAEDALGGATREGLSKRHSAIAAATRNKAAVCADMGKQCHDVADTTLQTQHLLVAMGIALAAQLVYDALLFFHGGGFKAVADRLGAEQAMRAAVVKLATEVAETAVAGSTRRAALHGAVHAAGIGALSSAAISVAAQTWDMMDGVRDEFDVGSFLELVIGGVLGGVAGAEVGRRLTPRVLGQLGGRATTNLGRLTAHMGGTMLIGGVGGIAGGVAGVVPSLIIHHEDIHSLGDMFTMVRESVITGFGSGFVGAAGSSLRVHQAGRDAMRGSSETFPAAARQGDFAARIDELFRSGESPRVETIARTSAAGEPAELVQRLTFQDGTQVIHEVVPDSRHAEFLTSLVGDAAVGAGTPAVHVIGEHVYTEVVPGKDAYPLDSNAGAMVHRMGDGWGTGSSRAFVNTEVIGPFVKQFQEHRSGGEIRWKDHSLTRSDVQAIRQRVEELRPAFSAFGRQDWHEGMQHQLGALEEHAVGVSAPIGGTPPPVSPPHPVGELPARAPESNNRRTDSGSPRVSVSRGNDRPPLDENHGRFRRPWSRVGDEQPQRWPAPLDEPSDEGPLSSDETIDDGTPTRPQPGVEPDHSPARDDYRLAAAPPTQTMGYRPTDTGHVDVIFTGLGRVGVPLRLVPGQEYVLGRGADTLLGNVATDGVARRHAAIRVDEQGHVFIRDNKSLYGSFIDGKQLVGENWMRIYDGQNLTLGHSEFTIAVPPPSEFTIPESGAYLDIVDQTPQTLKMVQDLSRIPDHIYQRVSDYLNAMPGGGIVIGNRPMLDLPGTESLLWSGTPYGRSEGTSWNTVQGVYMPGLRRIVINSGGSGGSSNVVWHEFGHALEEAYSSGWFLLSDRPKWSNLHNDMLELIGTDSEWTYYTKPDEAFAEAFTAWMHGGTTELRKFTLGNEELANRVKDYFDGLSRVGDDAPVGRPRSRGAESLPVTEEVAYVLATPDEQPQRRPAPLDEPSDDGPLSSDETIDDGTPTRPQPGVEPDHSPARQLAAEPPLPRQNHHPDGYVEVMFTGPDRVGVPLRLVPGQEYVLGRDADTLLANAATDGVAPRHTAIKVDEQGHVLIRDNNSPNGSFVDDKQLVGENWVRIYDGQNLTLGDSEFTMDVLPPSEFTIPEGGAYLDIVDQTPQTLKMVQDLSRIPDHIYQRVSDYLNARRGGGILIGNRPMLELPGVESLLRNPLFGRSKGTNWNTVQGLYISDLRRIVINSGGRSGSSNVVWHEFGHAVDRAYGIGWFRLSNQPKWWNLHNDMLELIGDESPWTYYNKRQEAFAEAFSAWMHGGTTQLREFTLGNEQLANRVKDYFDQWSRVGDDGPPGRPRSDGANPLPAPEEVANAPATPDEQPQMRPAPLDERSDDNPLSSDETIDDGTPTRPQPHVEPDHRPARDDDSQLAAEPTLPRQNKVYRHPDGYVEVMFTGPDRVGVPLRLVPGREYVLGRDADTLLANAATDRVAPRHTAIKVDEQGHVLIRDNNSPNGSFVDGKQLVGENWVRIDDGQNLRLGHSFEVGVSFQRQMADVRLLGDDGPTLQLYRGYSVDIGRSILHPDATGRSTVSASHARVGLDENGRVWIQDTNSTNGSRVNGDRLAEGDRRILDPGDSVQLGAFRGEAQFVSPNVSIDTKPVRVRLGSGPNVTPVRLEPRQSVPIGTDENSPFATQLREVSGVGKRHATLGLDHDGRLWIRDHRGSKGVWVNGERIAGNLKITLTDGDSVRLGPEFVGSARIGSSRLTELPPVALHFAPDRRMPPIRLEPGQEASVAPGREVTVGRDFDGRVWVRDPNPHSRTELKVNDQTVPAGEKRYLAADDKVTFDRVSTTLEVGKVRPLLLRLSDDPDAPPLTLRRGEEVKIGRESDTPMADQLAHDRSVSWRHATIYRDEYGDVWLRDERSFAGTWVNNIRVDPDEGPVWLIPGDRLRLGEWVGAVQFAGDVGGGSPRLPVRLNSQDGDVSLDLVRGSKPVMLGRDSSELPSGLSRMDELSRRHASIGAHPSGRVWIRDEGSNHTYVNGTAIMPGTKVAVHPGDQVRLADAYEFTIAFPPPEGGAFVDIIDQTPQTRQRWQDLARVPDRIYQRVSDYMNAVPGGGIVIGDRAMLDLPGTESLLAAEPPGGATSWNAVRGVYMPGPRRIAINSGGRGLSENVAWHEFGHAADAAYGTDGLSLSEGPEWWNLHAHMLDEIGKDSRWNDYYNKPAEAFAEAFTAWMHGGTANLRKFALGNQLLAYRLKDYFDRVFG